MFVSPIALARGTARARTAHAALRSTPWNTSARRRCILARAASSEPAGAGTPDEELQATTKVSFASSSAALPGGEQNRQTIHKVKGNVSTGPARLDKSVVPGRRDLQGKVLLKSFPTLEALEQRVELLRSVPTTARTASR